MADIVDIVHSFHNNSLDDRILKYMNNHPGKAYSPGRYTELINDIEWLGDPWAVSFAVSRLWRDGKIGRLKYGRRVYYGSHHAVRHLRTQLLEAEKTSNQPSKKIKVEPEG